MAVVVPFKGILYNPEVIADAAKVTAPPYDVISQKMQNELYRSHKYNIIRLILGKEMSGDNTSNNRYTRARDYLESWMNKKILVEDPEPAFYVYEQRYFHRDKLKTRMGFIGLMKIEDPNTSRVLPHEYTFSGPKEDRLKLLNEVKANLSPIFSLFEDTNFCVTNILTATARNSAPIIEIEIDGVNHKLWRMKDSDSIEKIRGFMKSKAVFIADGHHRYEVALAFRDLMKKKKRFRSAFNYTMVYFSNLNEDAVTILSTHRVIKNTGSLRKDLLLSRLKKFFDVEEIESEEKMLVSLEETGHVRLGLYCGKGRFYILTLRDADILDKLVAPGRSVQWRRLPVTVLHELVFNRVLKIKERIAKKENIIYTRDEKYAVGLVDRKGGNAAFFLNPTKVDQFKDIARSRDRMPHKSTYFYPKLLSGLVINKF